MRAKHRHRLKGRSIMAMADYGGGGPGDDFWYQPLNSFGGAPMTLEGAMSVSAVYACTKVLCETVASLPLIVYRRQVRGGKERATEHPLYELMHDQPNRYQTSFDWRVMLQGHCTLRGNAYARIIPGARGRVDRLEPLRVDRVRAELGDDGRVIYRYQPPQGAEQALLQQEVLRLTGLSSDGLNGLSVVALARATFGLAKGTESYANKLFQNGARPGGVLKHPGRLSPEARAHLRESWTAMHSGPENAGRVALIEEGMSWESVGMTSEDAQFLENRKFQVNEIARWFRIPPHMIGDLERATFSNIEHQSIDFVVHTLRPWLVMWEQSLRRDLMSQQEREELVIEFLVDGLLRGDAAARVAVYKSMLNDGWGTPNEVREKENLNPIEGGDELRTPLNMAPAGQPRVGQAEPKEEAEPSNEAEPGRASAPATTARTAAAPMRVAEVIALPAPSQSEAAESADSSEAA